MMIDYSENLENHEFAEDHVHEKFLIRFIRESLCSRNARDSRISPLVKDSVREGFYTESKVNKTFRPIVQLETEFYDTHPYINT